MSLALHKEVASETFLDLENLIKGTAYRFCSIHGGDYEEYLSEANCIFLTALNTYKPSRGKLSTWIRFNIWTQLGTKRRAEMKGVYFCSAYHHIEKKRRPLHQVSLETVKKKAPQWDLISLLDGLKEDSKDIVEMILDPPLTIRYDALQRGTHPKNLRTSIKKHLQEKLNWTAERIEEAFTEIGLALND